MKFPVIDPDTKEELGVVTHYKARIKTTRIYDNYSIAEGYRPVERDMLPFPSYTTTTTTRRELNIDKSVKLELDSIIRIGDVVEQIAEAKE